MSENVKDLTVRNEDGTRPAVQVVNQPGTAHGLPALNVHQGDSTGTAISASGSGTLLDLRSSGESKLSVDSSGNLTAVGAVTTTGVTATNAAGLVTVPGGVVSGSVLTAASTKASFTSEAQIVGLSIPANDPAAGAVYVVKWSGVYSSTGTPTYAFGLRYGGAAGDAIAAIAAITTGSGVSNEFIEMEAVLQFWSATTAVGFMRLAWGTSTTTNAASSYLGGTTSVTPVTVDSTTTKVMSVTVTCSASSSSNTISALAGYGARVA